jgi:hypothetical protein
MKKTKLYGTFCITAAALAAAASPAAAQIPGFGVRLVPKAGMYRPLGDLMFRPLPGIIPVQPYLFAGGGVKKYKFRDFTTATFGSDDNSSDPTLHAGAGVGLGIGPMSVVVEGGDYISRFKRLGDSKLQNDLYAMVGVKLGLF